MRLIAGATEGGAQLVVKPEITSPEQLKGKTIATPQLGNTQDIALKKWLKENGLTAGDGPDDVKIANLDNPRTLDAFRQGSVDGGWLPEPWSSRLVLDAGRERAARRAHASGRTASSRPRCCWSAPSSCSSTRRPCARCCAAHLKAIDLAAADPAAGQDDRQRRAWRSSPATRSPAR